MNTSFLAPFGTALQSIGLALIVGGLLALGAFTAPVLFKSFARPEAGEAMMTIFRRYDIILSIGAGLVIFGEVLRFIQTGMPPMSFIMIARYILIIAISGMTFYSSMSLSPQLVATHKTPGFENSVELHDTFNRQHKLSEKLAKTQLVAGLLLLLLTPFASFERLPLE